MSDFSKIVHDVKMQAREEVGPVPEPTLNKKVTWPVECQVGPGLEGAITGETEIGFVNGAQGTLVYRGFDTFDLAEYSNFEETAFLLLFGYLPGPTEYKEFEQKLRSYRALPENVLNASAEMAIGDARPMASLRTLISMLGTEDPKENDISIDREIEESIKLIAQIGTAAALIARRRQGKEPIAPDTSLSHAADLLRMTTGRMPSEDEARAMDISLILHADHGMNASTFTAMVVISSLSDMYSAIVGGIGSLKGPLHGGANREVLSDLKEIGTPDNVEAWYKKARADKRKIMGFGHRVYKTYDPRARILKPLAYRLSRGNPEAENLYQIAELLEAAVVADLGKEKKVFPNVDFYSGIAYASMGLEQAMFTTLFAASRVAGWTARCVEYLRKNRIFRPRAYYVGNVNQQYVPIDQRQ